jgi:predicted GNAT family acetyltransferase
MVPSLNEEVEAMTTNDIQHDQERGRFTLAAGQQQAILEYRLITSSDSDTPTAVNFTYTFVPPEFRGKGLAESLVRHGLRWAKDQNYDIHATCWYVAKFLH